MSLTVCYTDAESGDVASERVGLPAVRADLGDQLAERCGVAGQREDRRSTLGHRNCRGSSDTAGGAGDNHMPADQRARRSSRRARSGSKCPAQYRHSLAA